MNFLSQYTNKMCRCAGISQWHKSISEINFLQGLPREALLKQRKSDYEKFQCFNILMFWPLRLPIYCHDLNQYIVSGTKTHQYRKLDCIFIFREKDITILLLTTFDTFNVIFKGYKKYLFKFKDIYNCMLNSIKSILSKCSISSF